MTLPDHYGKTKIETVRRDFNGLRTAIRAHDNFATEDAWEKCERWIDLWPLNESEVKE